MAGVNKVILLGNLGDDPEMRHFENGGSIAKLSLATTETFKNKEGKREDRTDWHRVELNDGLARVAEQYLKKGDMIYVEGKLKKDTWQDNEGNNRSMVKVRGLVMQMLGGGNKGNGSTESTSNAQSTGGNQSSGGEQAVDDQGSGTDDLPF